MLASPLKKRAPRTKDSSGRNPQLCGRLGSLFHERESSLVAGSRNQKQRVITDCVS